MTFEVRPATSDDYASYCALCAEADEYHRLGVPWLFQEPAVEPRAREYFERLVSGSDCVVLVAGAGELVGTATVVLRVAPDLPIFIPQRWAVLDALVVAASYRRRGIGSALVRAAEAWACERGAPFIELSVYAFNDGARALYERLGYAPVSTKLRKPVGG